MGPPAERGVEIVKQSLDAGYQVTALVRDPVKLTLTHPKLIVKKGDVLVASTIEEAIVGQEAIISALGNRSTKPTKLYSYGIALERTLRRLAPDGDISTEDPNRINDRAPFQAAG